VKADVLRLVALPRRATFSHIHCEAISGCPADQPIRPLAVGDPAVRRASRCPEVGHSRRCAHGARRESSDNRRKRERPCQHLPNRFSHSSIVSQWRHAGKSASGDVAERSRWRTAMASITLRLTLDEEAHE
jgi:hypothetical protein